MTLDQASSPGKQRTPLSSRVAPGISWTQLSGLKGVNKAEIDVFLELFCFINDPTDVGNLISCSSAFPKSCLSVWKFMDKLPRSRRDQAEAQLGSVSGNK